VPGLDAISDLHDEAGFIDVPPQASGAPNPGRMFYVFETADEDAAHKPLAVFLAGGPGYPTSLDLLAYGTARATLDGSSPLGGPPAPNPARWNSFANLLFLDERQAGFSYDRSVDGAAPDAGGCAFSPIGDAADFARAVLEFLDGHGALQRAPVVLVGQSYGGERATLVLDLLLRYSAEAQRADRSLAAEIQAHYDAVFPAESGSVIPPAEALAQFGRVILLQPLVLGGAQYAAQNALLPGDPYVGQPSPGADPYDVRQPAGWTQSLNDSAAMAMADLGTAALLLAVDPRKIPRLAPAARADAFRVSGQAAAGAQVLNRAYTSALGPLGSQDEYIAYPMTACPVDETVFTGAGSAAEFVANLRDGVQTFISDARYDSVIYSPAIADALGAFGAVSLDTTPRAGVVRPGWLGVSLSAGASAAPVVVRYPPYVSSGHFVAVTEAQPLHDDVAAWLAGGP
jgi:hypothetical protein